MSSRGWAWVQRGVFSAGVQCVGGGLVVRDRVLRRIKRGLGAAASQRLWISSGQRKLDAIWVRPAAGLELKAAVLICHGIGEVVEHWARAQELLADSGVASLVFNYSGCGRSRGGFSAEDCERDAEAAFWWLQEQVPGVQITLLGFSLGSGVAAAIVNRIPVTGLVLCEAYVSFREALRSVVGPVFARGLVPDVWRSEDALRGCTVRVLVVHGECDRLFPVAMGERLARAAGKQGELIVVPGMGHADLHAAARVEDWRAILDWLHRVPNGNLQGEVKA